MKWRYVANVRGQCVQALPMTKTRRWLGIRIIARLWKESTMIFESLEAEKEGKKQKKERKKLSRGNRALVFHAAFWCRDAALIRQKISRWGARRLSLIISHPLFEVLKIGIDVLSVIKKGHGFLDRVCLPQSLRSLLVSPWLLPIITSNL